MVVDGKRCVGEPIKLRPDYCPPNHIVEWTIEEGAGSASITFEGNEAIVTISDPDVPVIIKSLCCKIPE